MLSSSSVCGMGKSCSTLKDSGYTGNGEASQLENDGKRSSTVSIVFALRKMDGSVHRLCFRVVLFEARYKKKYQNEAKVSTSRLRQFAMSLVGAFFGAFFWVLVNADQLTHRRTKGAETGHTTSRTTVVRQLSNLFVFWHSSSGICSKFCQT